MYWSKTYTKGRLKICIFVLAYLEAIYHQRIFGQIKDLLLYSHWTGFKNNFFFVKISVICSKLMMKYWKMSIIFYFLLAQKYVCCCFKKSLALNKCMKKTQKNPEIKLNVLVLWEYMLSRNCSARRQIICED